MNTVSKEREFISKDFAGSMYVLWKLRFGLTMNKFPLAPNLTLLIERLILSSFRFEKVKRIMRKKAFEKESS